MEPKRSGFTLLEMVVALALVGIVTFYVTDMLVRQNRAYTVVDEVTGAQQSLRAIADLMEREARVTGFMVPEGASFCGYDNTNGPDIVFFTDSDAINPANQTQTDIVAEITGGYVGGNFTVTVPGTGQGTVLDGAAFYDNNSDGVADADFQANAGRGSTGGVIVFDRNNPTAGTSCGIVTNVTATTITVDWNITAGVGGLAAPLVGAPNLLNPAGADLVAVPAHWYAILPPGNTGSTAPQLWRDGMLIADDVEDLQFAAFYDVDGDGTLDPGEYFGDGAAPNYVSVDPNPLAGGDPGDNEELRELRLNFVVRTSNQDSQQLINPATAQGAFEATENRVAPVQPADGFRRRVHTMAIKPRNIGRRS